MGGFKHFLMFPVLTKWLVVSAWLGVSPCIDKWLVDLRITGDPPTSVDQLWAIGRRAASTLREDILRHAMRVVLSMNGGANHPVISI